MEMDNLNIYLQNVSVIDIVLNLMFRSYQACVSESALHALYYSSGMNDGKNSKSFFFL